MAQLEYATPTNRTSSPIFAFFGTSRFSVIVLETLKKESLVPFLIVTAPDKPRGRNLARTPSPVKVWALENNVSLLQPAMLDDACIRHLSSTTYDLFLVASYGKIIPGKIISLPTRGTLNIHPSLLPKLRGSSPIQTAILEDQKETGVTIMELDEEMDHGPIVAQKRVTPPKWPLPYSELERLLGEEGSRLFKEILPLWLSSALGAEPQRHEAATYTKKIEKEDGRVDLRDDPYHNFLKINAFESGPGTYFTAYKKGSGEIMRVKIIKAVFAHNALVIKRVVPEGKKEMDYEDFLRGYLLSPPTSK